MLVSEIVLISRKDRTGLHRWMFVDVGKFGGLIETMDESIWYPLYVEKRRRRIGDSGAPPATARIFCTKTTSTSCL